MGTAGPLALARGMLEENGMPFFVLNSDVICKFPLREMMDHHISLGTEGTILATTAEDPLKYGVIKVDSRSSKIMEFIEKPTNHLGNRINAGIYVLNPSILSRIELRECSIEKEIFPVMAREGALGLFDLEGYWMDIGQPRDYLLGHKLHLEHKRTKSIGEGIMSNVLVDETARIGTGCIIGPNVVVGRNVVIGNGVYLSDTTVLDSSVIGDYCCIRSAIVGWECKIGRWCRLENYCVLGSKVSMNDCILLDGCMVLPFKRIIKNGNGEIIM
jgi:mannose-1-phosphate guanylyltransferase